MRVYITQHVVTRPLIVPQLVGFVALCRGGVLDAIMMKAYLVCADVVLVQINFRVPCATAPEQTERAKRPRKTCFYLIRLRRILSPLLRLCGACQASVFAHICCWKMGGMARRLIFRVQTRRAGAYVGDWEVLCLHHSCDVHRKTDEEMRLRRACWLVGCSHCGAAFRNVKDLKRLGRRATTDNKLQGNGKYSRIVNN